MSPTCYDNDTLLICWHDFYLECTLFKNSDDTNMVFSPIFFQSGVQTDGQKAMDINHPASCTMRWAQKPDKAMTLHFANVTLLSFGTSCRLSFLVPKRATFFLPE